MERFIQHFNDVKYFKIDDAYLGEVASKAGIDTHHKKNFRMFEKRDKCIYYSKYIVHHPVKTKACMETLYEKMKNETVLKHN